MGKRTVCKVCGTEITNRPQHLIYLNETRSVERCVHCAMHDISDNGQRKRLLNRGNGEEP